MPNSAALSSPKRPNKGKARAQAASKPASKSAATPKRHGGRKAGAVKWTITEYLDLFQVIAERRPSGQNDWHAVGAEHSLGGTTRSGETCKSRWTQVLKLPKPTGQSKKHPLHRLALAIDDSLQKANSTFVMNDASDDDDPYGELKYEFEFARDTMKRLKLDFKRAPDFTMPLPDQDAEVDEDEDEDEEAKDNSDDQGDSGDEDEGASGREDAGHGEDAGVEFRGEAIVMDGPQEPLEESTDLRDDEAKTLGTRAIPRSPSWDVERASSPPVPSTSKTTFHSTSATKATPTNSTRRAPQPPQPLVARQKPGPAPFPMSKTAVPEPSPSPKVVKAELKVAKSPEKLSGSATVNPAPKKRPVMRPKRELTPDVDQPRKSTKRKTSDEGREPKQEAPKASSSKASRSKGKGPQSADAAGEVINLISDEEGDFVNQWADKKTEDNLATVAFIGQKQKIERLEKELSEANATISDLRLKIVKLEHQLQVEAAVQEALAKRDQQAQVAVPRAPVVLVPASPENQPHILPAQTKVEFDPDHPFNQPPPAGGMLFDMPHMS